MPPIRLRSAATGVGGRAHNGGCGRWTVEHVAEELLGFAGIGADEVHLDLQFDPAIRTAAHYLDTAEEIMTRVRAGLAGVGSDAA